MTFTRPWHRTDRVGFALLRGLTYVPVLVAMAMIVSALSMAEAQASAFSRHAGMAQDECAMMVRADDAMQHPSGDASHPASKAMNCSMTCAFVMACELRFEGGGHAYRDRRPIGLAAPLIGIDRRLDLPPPKA